MISNPRRGQIVQLWYRKELREAMPYHGKWGEVVAVGTGRPRNHGVFIYPDGPAISVPAGQLRQEKPDED